MQETVTMIHQAKATRSTRVKAMFAVAFTVLPALVLAQQVPDAGRLLQQDRPIPAPPKADPGIQVAPPANTASLPGGTTVSLQAVRFTGNTVFSAAQLNAVLGEVTGKAYDLAGLQALAQRVSEHYRTAGYPFARAVVAQQTFADGVLEITVVEGRYGTVSATGDARLAPAAQGFLRDLAPGAVIESSRLARSTLILNDQPGIQTTPLIRPGQALGTGDLEVQVSRTPAVTGEWGVDNQGSRYTGEYRVRASLQWDSPFMLGDQMAVRGNVSDDNQWLGSLGYSLPLGASGLRGTVGYAHSHYTLAKQFASLNATGTADIANVGFSYPLVRSQQGNLSLAGTYQDKRLHDQQGAASTQSDKTSRAMPLTLQFDRRDQFAGGGITYGSLGYTTGTLDLDATLAAADATSAKTQGSFDKWNLDLARIQTTPVPTLTLFGRVSAQSAGKNLDSSEDFGLGGPNGVRAYPTGEGFGDEGWLVQIEARCQMASVAPYAFYDAGQVKTNKSPWVAGSNDRDLSGYGMGLRYANRGWLVDASLAWRDQGGPATSDTEDRNPRLWVTVGWRF